MTEIIPRDKYLNEILLNLEEKNIVILLGSRQTGKTTLLKMALEFLSNRGKTTHYVDLEILSNLKYFENLSAFRDYLKLQHIEFNKECYIGIDEFYYIKNATQFFKIIADNFKNIHILAAASSSLKAKKHLKESLSGRKRVIIIHPLSFGEYLIFKRKKSLVNIFMDFDMKSKFTLFEEFYDIFYDYLLFGGYPKVGLLADDKRRLAEIYEIFSSYIQKDIKTLIGDENIVCYNKLLKILSSQVGNLININELSNTIKVSRRIIEKYLFVLSNTYIISIVDPFYTNIRKVVTRTPKVYFDDSGIVNMALDNFTEMETRPNIGNLVENFVFSELQKIKEEYDKIYFFRTTSGTEIDFIYHSINKEILPVEVKFKNMKESVIPKGLRKFCRELNLKKAVILNKNFKSVREEDNTIYYFIPLFFTSKIKEICDY